MNEWQAAWKGFVYGFALGTVIFLLTGCMSLGPSPDQLKAITESPNMKCLRVSSVYGTLTFYDAGQSGVADIICGPDGFASKNTPPPTNAVIPMTITPTFQVGPMVPLPTGPPPPTVPRNPQR